MAAIIKFSAFEPRATWIVNGYDALKGFISRNGLPLQAQEAFYDLANNIGINKILPRLSARLEKGGEPTEQDVKDLWAAELRIPILLRASDALRSKVNYGSRSQELRFLTDTSIRAADDLIAEAQRSERVPPIVYIAITAALSIITWLLAISMRPSKVSI